MECSGFIKTLLSIALGAVLTGCSTQQIVSEAFSTADWFGRQINDRRSTVSRSTTVFYPNGVPEKMADLPSLTEDQLREIEVDLERQSRLLINAMAKYSKTLASIYSTDIAPITTQRVRVNNLNASVALLKADGDILIDVKVVQAVYRGILLENFAGTYGEETVIGSPGSQLERRQKSALRELINASQLLQETPAVPIASTLKSASKISWKEGTAFDNAMQLFNHKLEAVGAALATEKAADDYDDALAFIVAHEMGHRALRHYEKLKNSANQKDLELQADHFAAVLTTLSRNSKITPEVGYPMLLRTPRPMHSSFDSDYCFADINYQPTGFKSFFSYGYGLAGFDEVGAKLVSHPTKEERLKLARSATNTAYYALYSAQRDTGTCQHMTSEFRNLVQTNPRGVLDQRRAYLMKNQESYKKLAAKSGKDQSEALDEIAEKLLMIKEYDLIYLQFVNDLKTRPTTNF